MNQKLIELAENAGFVMWGDESDQIVDWSCDYDKELQQLYSMIQEMVKTTVIEAFKKRTLTTYDQGLFSQLQKQVLSDLKKAFDHETN